MRSFLPVLLLLGACQPDSTLWIDTFELDSARVALPYEAALVANEAQGEVSWFLEEGSLPPGLELSDDGVISGQASASGLFAFTVIAEDDRGEDWMDLEIQVPTVALVSGYEPFGGYKTNPSWDSIVPLHEQIVSGLDVRAVELPVEWDVAWDLLLPEIIRLAPGVVMGTGMSGTDAYRLETIAVNVEEGEDNAGDYRDGEPVVKGGPATLETLLPIDLMEKAVEGAGYETSVSGSAGTFLCNFLFYRLVYHALYEAEGALVAGFVHVPPAPFQGSFEVEDITSAHEAALGAIASSLGGQASPRFPNVDTVVAPRYGLE